MEFNYGDILTQETLLMQENKPEEFKDFFQQTKEFEKFALNAIPDRFPDVLNFLKECPHQKNLTHSIYKCLKTALQKRNIEQIQFYLETIGVDLSQPNFNGLLHQFIVQSGTQERNHMLQGKYYQGQSDDEQVLDIFLKNNKYTEYLLNLQDEGYGNTPLHVACGLYDYVFIRKLIDAGSDLTIKNTIAGHTPEDIIDEEIRAHKIHMDSLEKQNTLERLSVIKSLFAEYYTKLNQQDQSQQIDTKMQVEEQKSE